MQLREQGPAFDRGQERDSQAARVGLAAKVPAVVHGLQAVADRRLPLAESPGEVSPAREAANEVGRQRPSLGRLTTLYWEAIRQDILRGEAALQVLREVLAASPVPMAQTAARRLSDLRLLDMLAWAASS